MEKRIVFSANGAETTGYLHPGRKLDPYLTSDTKID